MENKKNVLVGKIFSYGGSYFGAVVGAGFASGQEVMQFYTNYGVMSMVAIIAAMVIFIWIGTRFAEYGNELHTNTHGPVMKYLCGKYVGKFFEAAFLFFMFIGFSVMISGGGTTLFQYFGINQYIGRVIIAVASVLAVSFGFAITLKIGGFLGPIIVVFSILVASIAFFTGTTDFAAADVAIKGAGITTSAPNIWISVLVYCSYCVMSNSPILISIGNVEDDKKIRNAGITAGAVALGVCLLFINGALLRNYQVVGTSEIPMVELAGNIWKPLGVIYAVVLVAAIFTVAISALYGITSRVTTDDPKKKIGIISAVSICAMVPGFLPFSSLVGTLYPIMGYMGLIVMASVLYHQLKKMSRKPKSCLAK